MAIVKFEIMVLARAMRTLQRAGRAGLFGAFLVASTVVGCGEVSSDPDPGSDTTEPAESSDPNEGSDSREQSPDPVEQAPDPGVVYAAYCAGCHGPSGEGTAQAYQIRQPVVGYATWVIRNGRPGEPFEVAMPAFSEAMLDATTLGGILDWLIAQPKPTSGQQLYLTYCGNCHGEIGGGGVVREGIRYDAEDEPEEVLAMVRGGSGGDRYNTRGSFMPAWSEDELTDAEVWLIIDFLRGGDGSAPPDWGG